MGNAKSRNNNPINNEQEISSNLIQSSKFTALTIYRKEDDEINVGGTTIPTGTAVGGPLLVDVKNIATKTTTSSISNKEVKDPQHYHRNQRQQKAADNSAASVAADQQRLKQGSSFWSLGSLKWNLSYSGRNSYKQRQQKPSYSTLQYQRKRSKTQWHRPITNAIFSSHFKETSRNEEFHIDQLVAKGAFGVVFKVIDKKSIINNEREQRLEYPQVITAATTTSCCNPAAVYALKVLKKSKIITENSLLQIKDEVDIQKVCGHHPFIVKQFDLWQNRYNLHILSEYIPNGELFSTIHKFSLNLIRLYLAEIALALDFLHNAGIIYRDTKPENILLTHNYHIKLTDFGLSKWLKLGLTTKTMCGTFQYMAPEILRGEPYTHAVDWWSLGIIVCQMFVERSPDIRQFITINLSQQHLQPQDTVDDAKDLNGTKNHIIDSLSAHDSEAKLLDIANFLPPEVNDLCHEAKDVLRRLLVFDAPKRIRSVRALQKIAMYKNFKIERQYCLKIQPLDIMAADNIVIKENHNSRENSFNADKAFHNF